VRDLTPITTLIAAPRVFVFMCLATFDETSPIWPPGLEPELIDRQGSVLTVRLFTRVMGRTVVGLQRVRLYPPERITFEHLEGLLQDCREEVTLIPHEVPATPLPAVVSANGNGRNGSNPAAPANGQLRTEAPGATTCLEYRRQVAVSRRLGGGLLERTVAAPLLSREARHMLDRWRVTIEAAALASGMAAAPTRNGHLQPSARAAVAAADSTELHPPSQAEGRAVGDSSPPG